ncbi:unnamed protein product [Linum tenue]|uniref:Uncharacterized protein n=1 Tax=Linum tenue TaxID=586396 RepID=A0AAV0NIB4_9ROSI|nr:unnamed protein product [Linum tenue]
MQREPASCQETGGIIGEVFLNLCSTVVLLHTPILDHICQMRKRYWWTFTKLCWFMMAE